MKKTSILIVEDHPLVRRGIRGLLQVQPDFRVVGEAANGLEALHMIEQLQPEVVITDIVMPMVGGLDLLRELSVQTPRPVLIVLSLFDEPRYVQEATDCGAAAYVLKQSAPTYLVTAIRDIELAMGNGVKAPSPSEIKNLAIVRKSLVAFKTIEAGELFSMENICAKRPGTGISPMRLDEVLGKPARRRFAADELIEP
ncbi:MAG: response regulator [Verrucomicrobia bacterium]|nr:response regulator [Verrucomicrobiota bacterium]